MSVILILRSHPPFVCLSQIASSPSPTSCFSVLLSSRHVCCKDCLLRSHRSSVRFLPSCFVLPIVKLCRPTARRDSRPSSVVSLTPCRYRPESIIISCVPSSVPSTVVSSRSWSKRSPSSAAVPTRSNRSSVRLLPSCFIRLVFFSCRPTAQVHFESESLTRQVTR